MPPDTNAVAASWKRESDAARDRRPDIVALHGALFTLDQASGSRSKCFARPMPSSYPNSKLRNAAPTVNLSPVLRTGLCSLALS